MAELWATVCSSTATDAKGALQAIRLYGDGMKYTPFEMFVGGVTHGTKTTSGGHCQHVPPLKIPLNVSVNPGQAIYVDGSQVTGADAGTTEVAVTLVFTQGGGRKRYSYIREAVAIATTDTAYEMTLDGAGATVNGFRVPMDVSHITGMIPVIGGITLNTESGGTIGIKMKGALPDGEQKIIAGGGSSLNTDPALNSGWYETEYIPTDIALSPGGIVQIYAAEGGGDWGTMYAGLTLVVE